MLPTTDLKSLRERAGLSQGQLATMLHLAQSQVSRYEQDPDNVPLRVAREWEAACGRVAAGRGVSVGTPYADLSRRLQLIEDYCETAPRALSGRISGSPPDALAFVRDVRLLGRKPRVAICGEFDAGKSRMCNTLLGGDHLPASYTPTTSIICLIRHVQDRPKWQREEVWIMREGFDLDKVEEKEHCEEHRILSGSFDTLRQYGAYEDGRSEDGPKVTDFGRAYAAIVYIDSPFLLGCDLIDLPGYGNSTTDSRKAEFTSHLANAVIYCSQARGFLKNQELVYLSGILKRLPAIETDENRLPPLPNLFIVATHADGRSISDADLHTILDRGAERTFRNLEAPLQQRGHQTGCTVTAEALRKRFFGFWVEDIERREAFQTDLAGFVSSTYPVGARARLDRAVRDAKLAARQFCGKWIGQLSAVLDEQDRVDAELKALEAGEPARRRRLETRRKGILAIIHQNREDAKNLLSELRAETTPKMVEDLIRSRYESKKEAQELAASYLGERLQGRLNEFLADRAERLVPEINQLLTEYNPVGGSAAGISPGGTTVPFNAQGAFMGALAAAGTAGALAAWAAAATAGSNLGAWLLIPQVVSFLASIGIGVGGTATAVSAVAAIGGPVTILIGLAVLAGLIAFALFGSSWQGRLARKIVETLEEKKFFAELGSHADKFWDDTRKAFDAAVEGTELAYREHLEQLRRVVTSSSREELEGLLRLLEETRDFFGSMPWKAADPTPALARPPDIGR